MLENELIQLRARSELVDTYERQTRRLKEDINHLTNQKAALADT